MSKGFRIGFFILVLFFLSGVVLFGFEWPVKKIVLTATFCESRGDHFHNGIDLGGGEQNIYPIADGKVVFEYSNNFYSSLPIGLGNFVVLQHKGNMRSIYCHLKDGSIDSRVKTITHSNVIGRIGDTGHSWGKHLHLSIIDMETNTFLNPLSLLPPIKDGQPPIIKNIYIKVGKNLNRVNNRTRIKDGSITLIGEIYDLREDVKFIWKLAPYSITIYRNGMEVHRLSFDSISGNGGRLVLSESKGNREFSSIYVSDWKYNLGDVKLLTGENHFLIVARDFAGNEATKDIFIFLEK